MQNQPLGTSGEGTALGSISQEHVPLCISSRLCHRCKILSLRRWNFQQKEEIHPKRLCRPLKCWFGSFTSFHKPLVVVPSFCQGDFRPDESFLKANPNKHPKVLNYSRLGLLLPGKQPLSAGPALSYNHTREKALCFPPGACERCSHARVSLSMSAGEIPPVKSQTTSTIFSRSSMCLRAPAQVREDDFHEGFRSFLGQGGK